MRTPIQLGRMKNPDVFGPSICFLRKTTSKPAFLSLEYKADVPSFFGSSSVDRILHHAQTLVEELNAEREHDGYAENHNILLTLPAFNSGGIHHGAAFTACAILANCR